MLNKNSILLSVGETTQLRVASILPETALNKEVEWLYDEEFVSIDTNNGTITAKKEGQAYITVRALDNNGAITYCVVDIVNAANRREGNSNEKFTGENQDW